VNGPARLLAGVAFAGMLGVAAGAEDTMLPAQPPARAGYAFERPALLQQQRIFGLAHGVHLLLSGCLDRQENAPAARQSYDLWYARQHGALERVRSVLADHFFVSQATPVRWQDIAHVLGLKETIYPSLGDVPLAAACASLPQALAEPRYDFAAQLEKLDDAAR